MRVFVAASAVLLAACGGTERRGGGDEPHRDGGRSAVLSPGETETRPGREQPRCYRGQPLTCLGGELEQTIFFSQPGPILTAISVYESHGSHGSCDPRGVFDVVVSKPGMHTLVLASYEPVEWNVVVAGPEVTIDAVTLIGHHHMTSRVPPGTVVSEFTYEGTNTDDLPFSSYGYPSAEAGDLIRFAERQTGLKVCSYFGAYCGNRAVIE